MELEEWALPKLSALLPLDAESLKQIISYTESLNATEASEHLRNLLGDSPQALDFISSFNDFRSSAPSTADSYPNDSKTRTDDKMSSDNAVLPVAATSSDTKLPYRTKDAAVDSKVKDAKTTGDRSTANDETPPNYAPPSYAPPVKTSNSLTHRPHTNAVIEAGKVRARDEQQMQNLLQSLQMQYGIYNSEIEPEHDTEYYCNCPIHNYQAAKYSRLGVQDMWSRAVMYPGEKAYNDNYRNAGFFTSNPYRYRVVSPYGVNQNTWFGQSPKPKPSYHARSIHQTIQLNNSLNREAQANIDAKEPRMSIWDDGASREPQQNGGTSSAPDAKYPVEKASNEKRQSMGPSAGTDVVDKNTKPSKLASFKKSIGIKSPEERALADMQKRANDVRQLRNAILAEEQGRWQDQQWRQLVAMYQEKVGMTKKIADLRARYPIQYLHLLRAGYFEPIPVAWAGQASNPLKFSIEAASGWRGLTPQWRGYEDTAEERLYWVLNHREGSVGMRMKPDFISEMNMARARMATAVEPPPEYYAANDTCHLQHTSEGYSKQVMPSPLRVFDRPEESTDDTMILLDVSGSMDFDPVRPIYNQYLITGYTRSTQPKNKDVAKAIIRRFTDAMANHDHNFQGYDLTTFSSQASYIGTINHRNLDQMWRRVKLGGGTRVMTGWQKVKELHFQKHSESATHHPIYGWQAGPQTPILRLLLLLDGEATDMDEFELDLLGLSWAHVTIFLIGVDGCPHHHRHANELQRISDVNHHVSFVDAQGNTPERFVTHELLKRHLGYEISISEFVDMEQPPPYSE